MLPVEVSGILTNWCTIWHLIGVPDVLKLGEYITHIILNLKNEKMGSLKLLISPHLEKYDVSFEILSNVSLSSISLLKKIGKIAT